MPSLQLHVELVSYTLELSNATYEGAYLDYEIHFHSVVANELGTLETVDFKGTTISELIAIDCFTQFYILLVCPFIEIPVEELSSRLEQGILQIKTPRSSFLFEYGIIGLIM